ncbi:hypothetical protein AGMMS49579_03300 [Spirochaetia bacterium]|nr:hypothetical protein AGMMS49579_03300 [Spirochaetia bacterium]
MNKTRFPGIAAGALAALALAVFVGCDFSVNPDYRDPLNMPPELPYFSIVQNRPFNKTTNPQGWTDISITLEWRRPTGMMFPDALISQKAIDDALSAALDTWMKYKALIAPQPFYDDNGNGVKDDSRIEQFATFSAAYKMEGRTTLVINRYWPAVKAALPNARSDLTNTVGSRQAAYEQAVEDTRVMMEQILESPLYEPGNELYVIYADMQTNIPAPGYPLPTGQQTTWDIVTGSVAKILESKGVLYYYYLGAIPNISNYLNDPMTGSPDPRGAMCVPAP